VQSLSRTGVGGEWNEQTVGAPVLMLPIDNTGRGEELDTRSKEMGESKRDRFPGNRRGGWIHGGDARGIGRRLSGTFGLEEALRERGLS
jgi:hypothetical protein